MTTMTVIIIAHKFLHINMTKSVLKKKNTSHAQSHKLAEPPRHDQIIPCTSIVYSLVQCNAFSSPKPDDSSVLATFQIIECRRHLTTFSNTCSTANKVMRWQGKGEPRGHVVAFWFVIIKHTWTKFAKQTENTQYNDSPHKITQHASQMQAPPRSYGKHTRH